MARQRWRSKQAREIAEAAEAAGGTVQLTKSGHLKVTGPGGVAIVGSAPDHGRRRGRSKAKTLATLRDKACLNLDGA